MAGPWKDPIFRVFSRTARLPEPEAFREFFGSEFFSSRFFRPGDWNWENGIRPSLYFIHVRFSHQCIYISATKRKDLKILLQFASRLLGPNSIHAMLFLERRIADTFMCSKSFENVQSDFTNVVYFFLLVSGWVVCISSA